MKLKTSKLLVVGILSTIGLTTITGCSTKSEQEEMPIKAGGNAEDMYKDLPDGAEYAQDGEVKIKGQD